MKYRKKPVVIEAEELTESSIMGVAQWCGGRVTGDGHDAPALLIDTLEGTMTGMMGDWIIRGVSGEFYPCKPDIFEKTYEKVEE